MLRRAWAQEGNGAPQTIWQARRESDFAALGGPSMVFDPLAEPEALAAAIGAADAVLALAGVISGSAEELSLNTALTEAVVRAAAGKPVFVASSAAVYGAPDGERPLRETDPLAPLSPYGMAKAAMEAAIAGRPGVTILRIGNVAGADALLGRAAPEGGRVLDVFADGRGPHRSYIGPQALARAIARLTRLAVAHLPLPAVVNLALPGTVTMDALLAAQGEGWVPRPAPATAIRSVELDVSRTLALGLVEEMPATARAIVQDLNSLGGNQ